MSTYQNLILPVKGNIKAIYISSFLIAIFMTLVSIVGFFYQALIYPTDELIRAFVTNDVINFFVGVPVLLGCMWLTRRMQLIGLLGWAGALFFVLYNYLVYSFAVPLNWAFLIHLMLTVLSLYTLIGLVTNIDGKAVQRKLTHVVPEKLAGGVLVGLGLLFFLRVIGVVINAITGGATPSEAELAVNVADLFITPAWVIGGILLWRQRELGYVVGFGLLFQATLLFVALILFLLLRPFLTNTPFLLADVIVIFVMGLICFVPFGLFVRGILAQKA